MTRMPKGKLTLKQELVIRDTINRVAKGKGVDLVASTEKFYRTKNRNVTKSLVAYNNRNTNFREALITSLVEKGVLGADSKTEDRLLEGLDAKTKDGSVDYDARLKYVQEINKIAGVYAPETKKTLNLNLDMSEEDLDKHIKELQRQLE